MALGGVPRDKVRELVDNLYNHYAGEEGLHPELTTLGHGLFRSAFLYEDIVLKFEKYWEVGGYNWREREAYKAASKWLRNRLVPCLDLIDGVLVMEYGGREFRHVHGYNMTLEQQTMVYRMEEELEETLIRIGSDSIRGDLHVGNVNAELKAFDYAGTPW